MDIIPYVLLGDIHGRRFWKDILNNPRITKDTKIIFVGDYLDPYTSIEGITMTEAINNFLEILDYASANDNVKLLYGNHDCSYAITLDICRSRHDYMNHQMVHEMFEEHKPLFSFAYDFELNDQYFLITHSGVRTSWSDKYGFTKDGNTDIHLADVFNKEIPEREYEPLYDVSMERGGWNAAGSLIWSDVHECLYKGVKPLTYQGKAVHQIFGHTALFRSDGKGGYKMGTAVKANDYEICIDCAEVFYLDNEGDLRYLKNDQVVL